MMQLQINYNIIIMNKQSSTVSLRISSSLSDRLKEESTSKGISFNSEVLKRLEGSFRNNERARELLNLVELDTKFFRVKPSSTYYEKEKILKILESIDVDRIILAARKDDLNGAILVMIIHTNFASFVIDSFTLSMARKPRVYEVEEILELIKSSGLILLTEYCRTYVKDTRDFPIEEAISHIMDSSPTLITNMNQYVSMLKI